MPSSRAEQMADITDRLSIDELYRRHKAKLRLEWIAGRQGARHAIIRAADPAGVETGLAPKGPSLIGHMNLIHPHQIQVVGETELDYLAGLRPISMQDAMRQLFKSRPACVIVADGAAAPTLLRRKSNEHSVPLLASALAGDRVSEILHYFLNHLFADMLTLHGVYMEVMAIGVLITGPSGIGKSELALELISRGHRLIADDAPLFSRVTPDIINGACPEALQDFLEVRGLGILNVRELFGDSAIKRNKSLRLIVRLQPLAHGLPAPERPGGAHKTRNVLEMEVPEITLPVAPGRNLAIMLECAARNHLLLAGGYNATERFARRQEALIARGG